MTVKRLSGIVLFTGSVLFIVAASMPVCRVFAERVPETKLAIINAAPNSWKLAQGLFGLGALVAALGFFLAYIHLRRQEARGASFTAFILALVGALLWTWHVYLRSVDVDAFVHGSLHPHWLAGAYFILTQAALLFFGLALFHAHYPRWVGWLNIGASIIFLILLLMFGDLPPFAYYVITAITAIVLMRRL
jgi:hypothetical protein